MAKVVEKTRVKVARIATTLLHDQEALKNLQAYGQSQQSAFERARSEVAGVVKELGRTSQLSSGNMTLTLAK